LIAAFARASPSFLHAAKSFSFGSPWQAMPFATFWSLKDEIIFSRLSRADLLEPPPDVKTAAGLPVTLSRMLNALSKKCFMSPAM